MKRKQKRKSRKPKWNASIAKWNGNGPLTRISRVRISLGALKVCVTQLAEYRSLKPKVAGSIPVTGTYHPWLNRYGDGADCKSAVIATLRVRLSGLGLIGTYINLARLHG